MKTTLSFFLKAAVVPVLAASASAQWQLSQIGSIDLSPTANGTGTQYIGSNPSAIAWDGTDLYVAGFNNSGGVAPTALIKVTDALGTNPTLGLPFGQNASTPALRGHSGLDIRSGVLVAAYDPGTSVPNGLAAYDAAGTQLWTSALRGSCGVYIWARPARCGTRSRSARHLGRVNEELLHPSEAAVHRRGRVARGDGERR